MTRALLLAVLLFGLASPASAKETTDATLFPFGVRGVPPLRADRRKVWTQRRVAVDAGLKWLAERQAPNGSWDPVDLGWAPGGKRVDGIQGASKTDKHQIGVHALVLLAYLQAGYAPGLDHPHNATLDRGLAWLAKRVTGDERAFCAKDPRYEEAKKRIDRTVIDLALATWAMVEAYGMSGASRWLEPASELLRCLDYHHQPFSGWLYTDWRGKPAQQPAGETLVTSFAMLAAMSADRIQRASSFRNDDNPLWCPDVRNGDYRYRKWLDGLDHTIRSSFDLATASALYLGNDQDPRRVNPTWMPLTKRSPHIRGCPIATALATTWLVYRRDKLGRISMLAVGEGPNGRFGTGPTKRVLARLIETLTGPMSTFVGKDGSAYIRWYFTALATTAVSGKVSDAWFARITDVLLDRQRKDPGVDGSWDPDGRWCAEGGRLYSTAMAVLTLVSRDALHRPAKGRKDLKRAAKNTGTPPWLRPAIQAAAAR